MNLCGTRCWISSAIFRWWDVRYRGHLIAVKPSHNANCELARLISAQMRRPLLIAQTFAPPPAPPRNGGFGEGQPNPITLEDGGTLDNMQVMKILPHRYPFLMVDKMTKIDGNKITGVKNVSINEPYFQGHFPGHPIMPGVLQLEAMAQVAGILMLKQAENSWQAGLLHVRRKCEMAQTGAAG